jgi:hypothetical protein
VVRPAGAVSSQQLAGVGPGGGANALDAPPFGIAPTRSRSIAARRSGAVDRRWLRFLWDRSYDGDHVAP